MKGEYLVPPSKLVMLFVCVREGETLLHKEKEKKESMCFNTKTISY